MTASPTAPPRPSCTTPLTAHAVARGVALGCARCGGVWLDNVASQTITRALDSTARAMADAYSAAAAVPFPRAATGGPCPTCRAALVEVRVTAGGIHVDVCAAHGTWFERHELQGLIDAFARARAAEAAGPRRQPEVSRVAEGPPPSPSAISSEDDRSDLATAVLIDVAFDLVGGLLGALFDRSD